MRTFFAIALAGAVSAAVMDSNDFKFMHYIVQHSKEYTSLEEYNMRKANYLYMDAEIVKINQSNSTWTAGHNFMSDYSREEY